MFKKATKLYTTSDAMFRVLLLNPPFLKKYSRQSRSPCVAKGGTLYMPYYLAGAAGALEKENFKVKLIDAVAEGWTEDETINFVKQFQPEMVVLDTSTPSIKNDVWVAGRIKAELPSVHVNLVGTHPTNMSEECFRMSEAVDSVCVGEYDHTVRDLAKRLESGKGLKGVRGLSFREGGKIINNGPADLIKDLDELPFVSEVYLRHFGEEGIKKYFYASITWPEIQILTARGCPYNCSFCNAPQKGSYRARSIGNVVEEFEFIEKKLRFVNEVMVEDETFPANKKRTLDLCDELIKRGAGVRWSCNARVNTDMETMKKMKGAGCRLMCVGFESVSQESLNSVTKGTTAEMQRKFMRDCKEAGLLVNGCFILGLPTDTPETMQATIDFAKELNPNSAQFYPLMVYPGTKAFEWAKGNGFLETEEWSKWITEEGLHSSTVSRPELSSKELLKWCNKARLEFYTNPKFLGKMAKQAATSPREAVRIMKGGKVLFRHLLRRGTA